MRMLTMSAALLLSGCSAGSLDSAAPANGLPQELLGRVAGTPRACVSTIPNQAVRALNSSTIAYDQGVVIWVNRLLSACPGISPYNGIGIDQAGTQLCRGDRVRGLDPGGTVPAPGCNLQLWVPYRRP